MCGVLFVRVDGVDVVSSTLVGGGSVRSIFRCRVGGGLGRERFLWVRVLALDTILKDG